MWNEGRSTGTVFTEGKHCCGVAERYRLTPGLRFWVYFHRLLPPRTSRAAASWLQKQHNIWRGRLCIWQLCLTFISGGKSASIPCGHWLLEGCSHKQNAGGHLIFCLPSSPAPSKPNINTWNRDRSWQNVLKYKDVQKHHLHQHEPAILANLLALFEGGS